MTQVDDALLAIHADLVDDLEKARIAAENRLRALRDVKGMEGRGEYTRVEGIVATLIQAEHAAILDLNKVMRAHPLGPWVQQTIGVGEKQAARLLGCIGDPYYRTNPETGEVTARTVSQLWAYCGYRPGQRRQKGVKANWSPQAKMRAYLVAESCMKQKRSPYRPVYDEARAAWAEKDTSDGHKHAHALRRVAKEVLKDLWRQARPPVEVEDLVPA